MSIFDTAALALAADTVTGKLSHMDALSAALAVPSAPTFSTPIIVERGVPERPPRVAPGKVPRRSPHTVAGRAALLHAIAHIEYSAIDLALDHALRFAGLPTGYYVDWLGVAVEEAHHFRLLRGHLQTLGHDYGDFPVHDSLWAMAMKTVHDPLARMALVPRLLEARGLDATPPIQKKLAEVGDTAAAELLDIILRDEEGHVGLGDKWFRHFCAQRGLAPEPTFRALIADHGAPWPQAPMNERARLAAGFSPAELADLTAAAADR